MVEEKQICTEFEGLIHGISPERIIASTINPLMVCPMCQCAFWNPQMCSNPECGRTICEPCLKRAVEERETCEDCLQPTKYDPNPYIAKSLKNLTFRCQNHPKCSETLSYKDLAYHICKYDQMKCPISSECDWKGEREELVDHISQCPKEIIMCKNEGCGNKYQRENMEEHIVKCMFQNIHCPKLCGFEGRRGQLEEHLSGICPLVELECGYNLRGCEYSPVRKDYQDHINACLYQPKVLQCGYQVNLKDEKGHSEVCDEFPLPCSQCGYIFTRGGLLGHRCFPFLHGLIAQQEKKIETQDKKIESQEHKIDTMEQNMITQKNKNEIQEKTNEIQEHNIISLEQKNEMQDHQIVSLESMISSQGKMISSQDNKITFQDNKITVIENIIQGFKPHMVHNKPKYI